jgi:hypothetical protein
LRVRKGIWKDSVHKKDFVRGDSLMLVLEIKGALFEGINAASRSYELTSRKVMVSLQLPETKSATMT